MKNKIILILLLFGCGFAFSQDDEQQMDKLNKGQKKHLQIFRQIQLAMKAGKADHRKVFEAYYSVIVESCKVSQPQYQKQAENLQERADKALMDGKNELAERVGKVAKVYAEMSRTQLDIIKAYNEKNSDSTQQALTQMQFLETEMNNNRLKTIERDWLFPAEAEKLMIASAQKK